MPIDLKYPDIREDLLIMSKYICKLSTIFLTFFKIGLFTFGGGFAMIPILEKELVDKQGWIEKGSFIDAISLTQSVPGAVAVNLSIFLGYNLAGVPGAVVAAFAVALPSFSVILIIATLFNSFNEYPVITNIFKGIRPAVVGLIIYAGFDLSKNINWSLSLISTLAAVLILSVFFNINPVIIIFMTFILSSFTYLYNKEPKVYKRNKKIKNSNIG